MGNDEIASLLEETLEEEKEADQKLTEISMTLLESFGSESEAGEEDEEMKRPAAKGGTRGNSGRNKRRAA